MRLLCFLLSRNRSRGFQNIMPKIFSVLLQFPPAGREYNFIWGKNKFLCYLNHFKLTLKYLYKQFLIVNALTMALELY